MQKSATRRANARPDATFEVCVKENCIELRRFAYLCIVYAKKSPALASELHTFADNCGVLHNRRPFKRSSYNRRFDREGGSTWLSARRTLRATEHSSARPPTGSKTRNAQFVRVISPVKRSVKRPVKELSRKFCLYSLFISAPYQFPRCAIPREWVGETTIDRWVKPRYSCRGEACRSNDVSSLT